MTDLLQSLSNFVVRSNPSYCLRQFAQLSKEELSRLGQCAGRTNFGGVLIGPGSGDLTIKAISAQVAALFQQLHLPTRVGSLLTDLSNDQRDEVVANLILDGILDISLGAAFVNQFEAYDLVVKNVENIIGKGRLNALSMDALKHGERLNIRQPQMLAAKLYFFHRMPVTKTWKKLWPAPYEVLEYLGVAPGGPLRCALLSEFEMSDAVKNELWISWHRRGKQRGEDGVAARYKLYVSPHHQHIRHAFAAAVGAVPNSAVSGIKIGRDAYGLLRPDKFVVYFEKQDYLFEFAHTLSPRLRGLEAHGVPFSAPIDEDGMLSWGIDPSTESSGVGWYVDESWRIWICNRLAVALRAVASSANPKIRPWRFALVKLWLSGVDTRTWTWRRKEFGLP